MSTRIAPSGPGPAPEGPEAFGGTATDRGCSPPAVRSLAVYEPASIGDDDWDPAETWWRAAFAQVRALPADQRQAAFPRMLVPGRTSFPTGLGPAATRDERADILEDVLDASGFSSSDPDEITCPTAVLTGALSSRRFHSAAARLAEVLLHVARIPPARTSR